MGVFRIVSAVLGAGSAGLAVADRMAGAEPARGPAPAEPTRIDVGTAYPSQSEAAAALSAHVVRAREPDRPARR